VNRLALADGELVIEAKMMVFLDQGVVGPAKERFPLLRRANASGRASYLFVLLGRHCRPLERAGLGGGESPSEPPEERESLEGGVRGAETGPVLIETQAVRRPGPWDTLGRLYS
jgi:hypothetical protein